MPTPLILDTDMGNDVDDALALGVIHALASRGLCELRAITQSKHHALAPPYLAMLNRFYGRAEIPIGMTPQRRGPDKTTYLALAEGEPPPEVVHDAVDLLRQTLASAEDGSITLVQIGFSTNLAALLETSADDHSPLSGLELISQKVKQLSIMAGAFEPIQGDPAHVEFNVARDLPAAQTLSESWPTPMVFSGYEIGLALPYPASSIDHDFNYARDHRAKNFTGHPLVASYQLYKPTPHERPTFDLTSVLFAVLGERNYFDVSAPGKVSFNDEAHTHFVESAQANHRYLKLDDTAAPRVREALAQLTSQPPGHCFVRQ